MALTNQEIADIFNNIADMLEIQGENRFKFLSYRRAGETLGELPRDLQAYVDDGTLTDIPGIGKAISDKIKELLETDKLEFYEKLRAQVPESILQIKGINGVGPKKAKLFWNELNITTVESLQTAASEGKLRELPGMGAKSEQKIIESIQALSRNRGRTPIGNAKQAADTILAELVALPQVEEAMIAGSIRRGKTTIGDVDILAVSDDAEPIMAHFVGMGRVERDLIQLHVCREPPSHRPHHAPLRFRSRGASVGGARGGGQDAERQVQRDAAAAAQRAGRSCGRKPGSS